MAPSYVAALVGVMSLLFPDIPVDSLNTTANTLIAIIGFIVVAVRQVQTGRSTVAGTRPDDY